MSADVFKHPDIALMLVKIGKQADDQTGANFDALTLGYALRDELPTLRDRVPEECYAVVVGVTAILMRHGMKGFLADAPRCCGEPAGPLLTIIQGGKE